MTRALFVSDIHISSPEDPKYQAFLRWLEALHSQPPAALFLVGDIFDLWISDRAYFVERYAQAVQCLRQLRESGWEIHYFEGNHDLDLAIFWERQLGAHVHTGPARFSIAGRRVQVEHGDQMNPADHGYLFLRWFLRTPVMKRLCRWLPNRCVAWIGERASRASRDYTSTVKSVSDAESRELIRHHASEVHSHNPFDLLVCGHVHVSMSEWLLGAAGERFQVINLGTWLKEPLVLEVSPAGTILHVLQIPL